MYMVMSSTYVLNSSGQIAITSGSQVLVNNLQLSNPLPLASGGLGSSCSTVGDAQSALGLAIGSNVQAWNAALDQISGLEPSDGQVISYSAGSGAYVASTPTVNEYTADGSTLSLSGNQFSVAPGGISTSQIADASITAALLSADVAGTGITGGNGSALSVDGTVVQTSGNFDLAGVIQFQNSIQQQFSGQAGYCEFDQYELKASGNASQSLASVSIPNNAVMYAVADVSVCDDVFSNYGSFSCAGVVVNNDGSVSIGQLNSSSIYASSGLACNFAVSGSNLVLQVQGLTGVNLRWNANIKQVISPQYS